MVATSNRITRRLADCIFNCVFDYVSLAYRALNVLDTIENHGYEYQVVVEVFVSTLDYIRKYCHYSSANLPNVIVGYIGLDRCHID